MLYAISDNANMQMSDWYHVMPSYLLSAGKRIHLGLMGILLALFGHKQQFGQTNADLMGALDEKVRGSTEMTMNT